jgi:putative ABC transport system permease protein
MTATATGALDTAVLDAAVFGHMRRQPLRTALAILAIALGIALGLSIYLINRVAADEISIAARSLYGLADLSVTNATGALDESLYPRVAQLPGVAEVSPVVEVEAKLADRAGSLRVLGIDGFRFERLQPAFARGAQSDGDTDALELLDLQAVFLSVAAASELRLSRGDTLTLQVGMEPVAFRVVGVLPSSVLPGRAALMDIAEAQWRFDKLGRLSRIDVRLRSGAQASRVREAIERLAPSKLRVTTPGEASDDALRLSRSYRANLSALALVALFTGGFFVYSTQALAVLRRRREFALLHAIGVTRPQQLAALLSAGALFGLLGSLLGIAIGLALAKAGLQHLGGAIGLGYYESSTPQLDVRYGELAAFCALGIVVAIVGALRPAIEAARVPTARALKAGDVADAKPRAHGVALLALFTTAVAVLFVPPLEGIPLPGYVSIALLLVGAVVAMPIVVRSVLQVLPRIPFVPYEIALSGLAGAVRYAALSVSAIVVSFSLMVSMAIMVNSFRVSLDEWTQKVLPADLYLRAGSGGSTAHFDEVVATKIAALPGVARVVVSRQARATLAGSQVSLPVLARSFSADEIEDALWLMERAAQPAPSGTTPVWITEAAAELHGWRVAERFELRLGDAPLTAYVQGIWRDYEYQHGALVMRRADYVAATQDQHLNTILIWRDGDTPLSELRTAVRGALPSEVHYTMTGTAELREMSLEVFDRTFAITYVLEIVAVAIGLFGIAAGISAQVLARRGEFGALRHLGFTRAQLGAMLSIEGGVLGAIGVASGLLIGTVVSFILIHIVNRQSFHWSMDIHAPFELLAILSSVLIVAAGSIALWSGRQAMSADAVRAVKEDW